MLVFKLDSKLKSLYSDADNLPVLNDIGEKIGIGRIIIEGEGIEILVNLQDEDFYKEIKSSILCAPSFKGSIGGGFTPVNLRIKPKL